MRAIAERYKKIEGEWSLRDVERFAQEISGINYLREEVKLTDQINNQAIKNMRDGSTVSATIVDDINKAAGDIAPFVEAAKGTNEELSKWRRDKFDSTFAKYIHKYFLA